MDVEDIYIELQRLIAKIKSLQPVYEESITVDATAYYDLIRFVTALEYDEMQVILDARKYHG